MYKKFNFNYVISRAEFDEAIVHRAKTHRYVAKIKNDKLYIRKDLSYIELGTVWNRMAFYAKISGDNQGVRLHGSFRVIISHYITAAIVSLFVFISSMAFSDNAQIGLQELMEAFGLAGLFFVFASVLFFIGDVVYGYLFADPNFGIYGFLKELEELYTKQN